MSATLIVGHLSFPYSITPGATPSPDPAPDGSGPVPGSLAINLVDRKLFCMDHNNEIIVIAGNNYDEVLQTHFTAQNPHGTHDVNVVVDTGDVTIDPSYDQTTIVRIGNANATITLDAACEVGHIVEVDNVRTASGTASLVNASGDILVDGVPDTPPTTLTGKGQLKVIKVNATDWELIDITS